MKMRLGGQESNYDSRKNRGSLVNMIAEVNKDGSYRSAKKLEGLTKYLDLDTGPVRSEPFVNSGYIYVVSGQTLYKVDATPTATALGSVGGGTKRCVLLANAVPGDNQIMILNGAGQGYIYTALTGLRLITDADFFPTVSGTILDERFWLIRQGTNEFFGSDISNGLSYDPLTFASAEESPDDAVAVIAKKSTLWVLNAETSEYWQTFNNDTLPLRRVKGATEERGIVAVHSLAESGNSFCFLASDRTVRMVTGAQMETISDLEIELRIKGNGTPRYPGFTKIDDAIGFFIDGPVHKTYYLMFPSEGYVWGYDLETRVSHIRTSENEDTWRINGSTTFDNKLIGGDAFAGSLWVIDPAAKDEGGEIMRATLRTPTISFDNDVSVQLIEIDMETGTTTDPDANPLMMVRYTKDGETYKNHSTISLGLMGNKQTRIPLRLFGRVVRHTDFGLELEVTDSENVRFYGAEIKMEGGF